MVEWKKESADIALYYRALGLLARSMEGNLAVVGHVSDEWIRQIAEKSINVKDLKAGKEYAYLAPIAAHPHTHQIVSKDDYKKYILDTGKELKHPVTPDATGDNYLMQLEDVPEKTFASGKERDRRINRNVITGLNPEIRQHMVVGNLLLGANLDITHKELPDNKKPHDITLIVAAMISDTYGRKDNYSSLLETEARTIDDDYIREKFNSPAGSADKIIAHIKAIRDAQHKLETAVSEHKAIGEGEIPEMYHSVLAAKYSIRLQESAKAAAYGLLSALSPQQKAELAEKGFEPGNFRETEIKIVEQDLSNAKAALSLSGVDRRNILEPVQATLIAGVEEALHHNDDKTWHGLTGIGGKAFEDLRLAMPINDYKTESADGFTKSKFKQTVYSIARAVQEIANYHAAERRKGHTAISEHLLLTLDNGAEGLGVNNLRPIVAGLLLLHDIAEDASPEVSGINYSVDEVGRRMGMIMRQQVADLTDDPKIGHHAGYMKALQTLGKDFDLSDKELFEDGLDDDSRQGKKTDGSRPYSLTSSGPKAADFWASMMELIREPQTMLGDYFSGSGKRIGLAVSNKGFLDTMLVPAIAKLVTKYDQAVENLSGDATRQKEYMESTLKSGHVRKDLAEGLRHFLKGYLEASDQYMVQNLTILAKEFGMDDKKRDELITDFTKMDSSEFQKKYFIGDEANPPIFRQEAFVPNKAVAPKANYSAVFDKDGKYRYANITEPVLEKTIMENRDDHTLLAYQQCFAMRKEMRNNLGLKQFDMHAKEMRDVITRYESKMDVSPKVKGNPANSAAPADPRQQETKVS